MPARRTAGLAVALAAVAGGTAHGDGQRALFALIIGVNQSVDRDLPRLHYADDDAARYLELFRALGARTYLLSRLDEGTTQLFPQAAAEAHAPTLRELGGLTTQLQADIARARERHVETVLYFVYAGHGKVIDGRGYVVLEDAPLGGRDLEALFTRLHAGQTHAIIDACYSYYLAFGRGPGGERRPVRGVVDLPGLGSRSSVGLLLSTSSARESHEWDGFQAGVFSHEVRSGMLGAADADRDGLVTYREIAAFVERANAAIVNERFRPDVFARAPRGSEQLVDLRAGVDRHLELDGTRYGHYLVEDARGVRWADFHNPPDQPLRLRLPASGPLFVRHVGGEEEEEFVVPADAQVVALAALTPTPPRVHERGAAHEAFHTLFALPFDGRAVSSYVFRAPPPEPPYPRRRIVGWSALGVAAGAVAAAIAVAVTGRQLLDGVQPSEPEADVAAVNQRIAVHNAVSGVLFGLGAAAATAGVVLLALPESRGPGLSVGVGARF